MGSSLTYNSPSSTAPFPVSVLYELLARSRIMSPLPHTLYLFYKENYERLLSFDYNLFNEFVHFFLFSLAPFFPQMISLLKDPFLWSCFYSSSSHSYLTRVLSALKCRIDRIYSSLTQSNTGVFCWWVMLLNGKRNFRKKMIGRFLLFTLHLQMLSELSLLFVFPLSDPPSLYGFFSQLHVKVLLRSWEIEWVNAWTSLYLTLFLVPLTFLVCTLGNAQL